MHIGIVGPIATADIAHLIDGNAAGLPRGYTGAPLLATLINELLQRGHRVSAFTLSNDMPLNSDASVTVAGKNFSLTCCPMRPRAWQKNGLLPGRILDLYRFERRVLQQAISQVAPEVIHAHWTYEFSLAALVTKIPHVITCHDSPYAIARLNSRRRLTISAYRWLRVLMARKVLREAQCVTTVSPYMCVEVQPLAAVPLVVVPNPVDELAFKSYRKRLAPTAPRLVMISNGWESRKNPEPALLAFAQLRRNSSAAELHLYGTEFGPGETAQMWCKKRRILDGMVFHGSVSHHELIAAMAEFDLLLHPSLEESFGMVIAEAMSLGLPVVAGSSSGAVPWVVGEQGSLCDVRNTEAITQALHETIEAERYAQLSLGGMLSARARFSTAEVVDQYFSLYQKAIQQQATSKVSVSRPGETAWKF